MQSAHSLLLAAIMIATNQNLVKPEIKRVRPHPMTGKPNPNAGRRAGTPNKITHDIKTMVLTALNKADPKGGAEYLRKQAIKQPVAFMGLLGKILPTQITGAGGGPIRIADEASLAKLAPSELEALTRTLIHVGLNVELPNNE